MIKLKWLDIKVFRQTRPTRLVFDDRFNVLLGKNGTGKSTLLDLVSAAFSGDFSLWSNEALDVSYRLEAPGGSCEISVLHQLNPEDSVPEALEKAEGQESRSTERSAQVSLRLTDTTEPLVVEIDKTGARIGDITTGVPWDPTAHIRLNTFRALTSFKQSAAQHLFSVAGSFVRRFDESLGYRDLFRLYSVTLTLPDDGGPALIQVGGSMPDSIDDWFREQREVRWDGRVAVLIPSGSKALAELQPVAHSTGFQGVELSMQLRESKKTPSGLIVTFGDARLLLTRSRETVSDDTLSFGQKRLLSFGCYLMHHQDAVVADELVNGLHYSWIEDCLKFIGERQAFMTSQNPLLLDFLRITDAEQALRMFIRCSWEDIDKGGPVIWENITREEADDFMESYKVGFQQVGELLRVKGLW
jgi:energy-coupling factor transporter ATP-binding protein EcfA2